MPDPIALQTNRIRHIVANEFKTWMSHPLSNVFLTSGEIIIQANHFFACFHQAINQMGTNETGSSRHQIDQQSHPKSQAKYHAWRDVTRQFLASQQGDQALQVCQLEVAGLTFTLQWLEAHLTPLGFLLSKHESPTGTTAIGAFELLTER